MKRDPDLMRAVLLGTVTGDWNEAEVEYHRRLARDPEAQADRQTHATIDQANWQEAKRLLDTRGLDAKNYRAVLMVAKALAERRA